MREILDQMVRNYKRNRAVAKKGAKRTKVMRELAKQCQKNR